MLVLNRRVNQSIAIGDDVRVIVIAVDGDRVKIGVQAPDDLPVHRAEVYDQILRTRTKPKR